MKSRRRPSLSNSSRRPNRILRASTKITSTPAPADDPAVSRGKMPQRIPYTDQDDWNILDYLITNDLVE